MTGQDILTAVENIIDDDIDPDYALFIMNSVKDEIEAGRDWTFNRGFDNSQKWNTGDTYLTTHPLPADFLAPRNLFLSGDISPYILISYDLRERFKDIYKRYYIDQVNKTFALCGSGKGGVAIDMYYARSTPALTLTTSPVWPSVFHSLLVYKMAERWASTSDADDLNYRMSKEQLRAANDIMKQFIHWDAKLKTAEYNAKNERRSDLSSYPDVVGTNYIF